jgi:hypothetical protein
MVVAPVQISDGIIARPKFKTKQTATTLRVQQIALEAYGRQAASR